MYLCDTKFDRPYIHVDNSYQGLRCYQIDRIKWNLMYSVYTAFYPNPLYIIVYLDKYKHLYNKISVLFKFTINLLIFPFNNWNISILRSTTCVWDILDITVHRTNHDGNKIYNLINWYAIEHEIEGRNMLTCVWLKTNRIRKCPTIHNCTLHCKQQLICDVHFISTVMCVFLSSYIHSCIYLKLFWY